MQLAPSSTWWSQDLNPGSLTHYTQRLSHRNPQLLQIPQHVGLTVSGEEPGHSCSATPLFFAFCCSPLLPHVTGSLPPSLTLLSLGKWHGPTLGITGGPPQGAVLIFPLSRFYGKSLSDIQFQHLLFSGDPKSVFALNCLLNSHPKFPNSLDSPAWLSFHHFNSITYS